MELLSVDNIRFGYSQEAIIKDILMDVKESEIVGILGPNGSGKTTLIKCINRILEPKQGCITLDGEDLTTMSRRNIAKHIGYVPQNAASSISMPTVYEVVIMGRTPHNMWKNQPDDDELIWNIMDRLNISHLANRGFDELSSGQVQRVLIARAIAQEAKLLLLDEPTSNLDVKYQMEVMDLIRNLVDTEGISACAIIHDLDLAARYCDRIILMRDGEIKAFGTTSEVLTPDNIRDIFEIEAETITFNGIRHVIIV